MKRKKTKLIAKYEYKDGEGFAFFVTDAPPTAKTKADVIACCVLKKNRRGRVAESSILYYTPDEAFSVAQGLLSSVRYVMHEKFINFRKEKDTK